MGRVKQTARVQKDVSPHADLVVSPTPAKKPSKGKKEVTGSAEPKAKKARAPKKEPSENPLLFIKSPFQTGTNVSINFGKLAKTAIAYGNGEPRFAPSIEMQAAALRLVFWQSVMEHAAKLHAERKEKPDQAPRKKTHLLLDALAKIH